VVTKDNLKRITSNRYNDVYYM